MNSFNLRVRASDNKAQRINTSFDPVILSDVTKNLFSDRNEVFKLFMEANSEKQLSILKGFLTGLKEGCDDDTVNFLVLVYLQAITKHPVKCMLSRFVTKNKFIQQQFSDILTKELEQLLDKPCPDYKSYVYVVTKLTNCTENFPTGATAVKNIEIKVARYLKDCLICCINTLGDDKPLTPTEKNKIYTLAHQALRMLLYIVQKLNEDNIAALILLFDAIKINIKSLLCNDDAPMDTKSVCGILYVSMHVMENGPDSWINIVEEQKIESTLQDILTNDAGKLSIYSAMVTTIPMERLQINLADGEESIMRITNTIVEIGERWSLDNAMTVSVFRAVVSLSRWAGSVYGLTGTLLAALGAALEHPADAVQHLATQALKHLVANCAEDAREGNQEPIDQLFTTLMSLGKDRKSFYLSLTFLISELGAERILQKWPNLVRDLIFSLGTQSVQASVTTALEMLLQKHIEISTSATIYQQWIQVMIFYIVAHTVDTIVMGILENLIVQAVKLNADIADNIDLLVRSCARDPPGESYTHVLMCVSGVRRAGRLARLQHDPRHWRRVLPYSMLRHAVAQRDEEERIVCISLIVESPKTTEIFEKDELHLILWFLKNNINAQSPHFRQIMLSILKKFVKRFESSYKVLTRGEPNTSQSSQYYLIFVDRLREFCFECLIKGANYGRRYVALQILLWTELMNLDGYVRRWNEEQVETMLYHLGDSYENNKALALGVLKYCPVDMLKSKKYSTSLDLNDIITEASSVKPTDCVTAVYKLKLLKSALPEYIVDGDDSKIPNKVNFVLLTRLLEELDQQLSVCEQNILYGARNAPMYGILHCISCGVENISPFGPGAAQWARGARRAAAACERVWRAARPGLCCAAPEGHLPAGNIPLEDGKEATSQMVLLCSWRSVKEVSLILSTLVTQALCYDEFEPATLRSALIRRVGEFFTTLLTEIKHRGAFEQVYVGFTRMLTKLWESSNPEFNSLPKQWLEELMAAIESGDTTDKLCSTRRSAGLPFMIQALVTTSSAEESSRCVLTLLRLAGGGAAGARVHCLNVLRALVRDARLAERLAQHLPAALLLALRAFERDTWLERNAGALLFAALLVRMFGVVRGKDVERLSARNTMTGRVFFLKYPLLYDYMLYKLKEINEDKGHQLRPALYPILLLLARLYPSSLEGTVSNLKLGALAAAAGAGARRPELRARRLAARAAAALAPRRYVSHVQDLIELLGNERVEKNYCHGILLQVVKILERKPEKLAVDRQTRERMPKLMEQTLWVLRQSVGEVPCYVVADEYIRMCNIVLWNFDVFIKRAFVNEVQELLNTLIFNGNKFNINPGKELCLANAVYLQLIISYKYECFGVPRFVYRCLAHENYEVVLSILNFFLIMNNKIEYENSLQEHLSEIADDANVYDADPEYIETLCEVFKNSKYSECTQKALRLVTLHYNMQRMIICAKNDQLEEDMPDEVVIDQLIHFIHNEHENLTHMYLGSLCEFLCDMIERRQVNESKLLEIMRVIFSCSLSENNDDMREAVVEFLDNCFKLPRPLNVLKLETLSEEDRFEVRGSLWAAAAAALTDQEAALRARAAAGLAAPGAGGAAAQDALLRRVADASAPDRIPMLVLLALLDFRTEVCAADDDLESRVFDENEKYNLYLEETFWTRSCVDIITHMLNEENALEHVRNIITHKNYRQALERLCNGNLTMFENAINGIDCELTPKVELFIKMLKK